MQQYRRSFRVIDSLLEKLGIQGDYLKREVSGCVGVVVTYRPVPPVISAAIGYEVAKDKALFFKPLLRQNANGISNDLSAIVAKVI